MTEVTGDLHVRLRFTCPPSATVDLEGNGDVHVYVYDLNIEIHLLYLLFHLLLLLLLLLYWYGGCVANNDDFVEDPDTEDKEPNLLEITVIQGRGLKVMDTSMFSSGGTSDPFVRLRIEGFKDQQTAYIRKTINPIWNEKLSFSPFLDGSATLQVTVKDYNDIALSKFMGRIYIPLNEFSEKKPKKAWYKLQGADGPDSENRGEVELFIHWKFDVLVRLF